MQFLISLISYHIFVLKIEIVEIKLMMHCMNMFLNVSLSVFLCGIKVKLFKLQTGSSFTVKISIFNHLMSMVMFLFLNILIGRQNHL